MNAVSGHSAVRAMRRPIVAAEAAHQKHELFPTPPWAVRALFEHVLPQLHWVRVANRHYWDPCAGLGHMSDVLKEYSARVDASDIIHYELDGGGTTESLGIERYDFLSGGERPPVDWIITNPPFSSAELFLEPALRRARCGVAFFERLQWLETIGRYERVFSKYAPFVSVFTERVPICEGGYDPQGSMATAYAWFVWAKNIHELLADHAGGERKTFEIFLIPPGCRETLSQPSDLLLAKRCVRGFVPPSKKRKARK